MAISKEVLDELMKEYKGPDDITGPDGLIKQLTKALVERAMQAEMTEHLGYEAGDRAEKKTGTVGTGHRRRRSVPTKALLRSTCPAIAMALLSARLCLAPAGVQGLRRQDPVHVRPWDDNAGDRRTPERDLRERGFA